MGDFQIKYFAERLKELAKRLYGSNKNLSKELREDENYLNRYTNRKKPTEPGIGFLYNLLQLDQINPDHIFWLLTGESLQKTSTEVDSNNKETYSRNSQSFAGENADSQSGDSAMHGNFIGEPKEIHYHNELNQKLLEELTQQYKENIQTLKQQLVEKEKRIKELEDKLKDH